MIQTSDGSCPKSIMFLRPKIYLLIICFRAKIRNVYKPQLHKYIKVVFRGGGGGGVLHYTDMLACDKNESLRMYLRV